MRRNELNRGVKLTTTVTSDQISIAICVYVSAYDCDYVCALTFLLDPDGYLSVFFMSLVLNLVTRT